MRCNDYMYSTGTLTRWWMKSEKKKWKIIFLFYQKAAHYMISVVLVELKTGLEKKTCSSTNGSRACLIEFHLLFLLADRNIYLMGAQSVGSLGPLSYPLEKPSSSLRPHSSGPGFSSPRPCSRQAWPMRTGPRRGGSQT